MTYTISPNFMYGINNISTTSIHNLIQTYLHFFPNNKHSIHVCHVSMTNLLICNIPMSFLTPMNAPKDFTHCIVPSRIEPTTYSCPFDLGSILFWGHHIAMFCHPKSAIISFCSFMFIISIPLCCPRPYIHTKIITMKKTLNNKSQKKKLRKKENAKG